MKSLWAVCGAAMRVVVVDGVAAQPYRHRERPGQAQRAPTPKPARADSGRDDISCDVRADRAWSADHSQTRGGAVISSLVRTKNTDTTVVELL